MSVITHHTSCPCCTSFEIEEALVTEDYTVSKEIFSIWECKNCTVRFTQNIPDENSIASYYKSAAYISHSDTNEGFINKLYHFVRNITLQSKKKLIIAETGLSTGNLLDIGAGTGAFANTMKNAGWQVYGLEPDETASHIALQKFGLTFQHPNTMSQLQGNLFNAITLWHVLEHVHDVGGYMQSFVRLLKPDGKLFIAVPNYVSTDASIYKKHWAAYDVPRHLYHFSPESMNRLASKYGFIIKAYKPMWFDSFYVSMLSEKYKNGKDNFIIAVLNGLYSNLKTMFNIKNGSSIIYVLTKAN
jgi:2-polyprenyl-3-methyl-5-hydroxy-6-metoxy-1,4-benzoquinol methylase